MSTIHRILCPIDFSDASEHVIAHAAALARWRRADLSVLYVQSPLTQRLPHATEEWTDASAHQSDPERVRRRVEALLAAAGEPLTRAEVLVDLGQPVPRILERAAGLPADLIVLGTHGLGGVERLALGSVAEKVLRRAPCDVLVVPPRVASAARLPYASILCGVDFSDVSQRAFSVACELAADSGASITLLHAIGWPWNESSEPDLSELPAAQAAALGEYCRYVETTAAARLRDLLAGSPIRAAHETVLVRHGKSHRELLRAAREQGADLIVLGVHGRSPVDVAFFGSTASQVVRVAACPVWIVRLPGR